MSDPKASKHLTILHNRLRKVDFNPRDVEHMSIARTFLEKGRQDPEVRFNIEAPYLDVRSLILGKIAKTYTADFFKTNKAVKPKRPRVAKPTMAVLPSVPKSGGMTDVV